MSRYQCHLFDVDGTLIDSTPTIVAALSKCLRDRGIGAIDSGAIELLAKGSPLKALRQYGISDLNSYWRHYEKELGQSRLFFPETKEILGELKRRGASIGVVSSLKTGQLKLLLSRFDLLEEFNVIIGWNDCSPRKPHPAPLLLALHKLVKAPSATTYTGDTESDMTAALSAGVTAVRAGWNWEKGSNATGLVFLETLDRILML